MQVTALKRERSVREVIDQKPQVIYTHSGVCRFFAESNRTKFGNWLRAKVSSNNLRTLSIDRLIDARHTGRAKVGSPSRTERRGTSPQPGQSSSFRFPGCQPNVRKIQPGKSTLKKERDSGNVILSSYSCGYGSSYLIFIDRGTESTNT